MVQWRICLTKTFDYQDTTGNNSVSRTPPRVTPLVPQDIFFVSKQQSYTRLRWRVHFVPSCNASMLHVYQTYRVYKLCIYIIHCYVLVYFVSYCRFQVSVLSYVLVKPENPSEYRLNEENLG